MIAFPADFDPAERKEGTTMSKRSHLVAVGSRPALAAIGLLFGGALLAQPAMEHKHAVDVEVPKDQAAPKPNLISGPHVYYFPEYDEGVAALPARKAAPARRRRPDRGLP